MVLEGDVSSRDARRLAMQWDHRSRIPLQRRRIGRRGLRGLRGRQRGSSRRKERWTGLLRTS